MVDYEVHYWWSPDETSADRKAAPMVRGLLDYFPDALEFVSKLSKAGNDKHNPGQPMHHARGKSTDHADCIVRHLRDRGRIDPETGLPHSAATAWRALALLQEELEAAGAPLARGARLGEKHVRNEGPQQAGGTEPAAGRNDAGEEPGADLRGRAQGSGQQDGHQDGERAAQAASGAGAHHAQPGGDRSYQAAWSDRARDGITRRLNEERSRFHASYRVGVDSGSGDQTAVSVVSQEGGRLQLESVTLHVGEQDPGSVRVRKPIRFADDRPPLTEAQMEDLQLRLRKLEDEMLYARNLQIEIDALSDFFATRVKP